jgi:hypothetical protein
METDGEIIEAVSTNEDANSQIVIKHKGALDTLESVHERAANRD